MRLLLHSSLALMGADKLRGHFGDRVEILESRPDTPADDRATMFADADAIISFQYTGDLPPAPNLKLMQIPASGFDMIDFEAVPTHAWIANVYEHETGIAEYVFAGMLEWTIGLHARDARFRSGDWSDNPRSNGKTRRELAGTTVGLIGYGHIGQAIAQRAQAFDMKVLALTRNPRDQQPVPDLLTGYDQMAVLLERSDFLIVCCPLTEETEGMIGADELAAMRPDAILFNVARGPIVNPAALYAALVEKRIRGAVIDTWYTYPTPEEPSVKPAEYPFETLDNIVMTAHLSGWTDGNQVRRWERMIENIEHLMAGEEPINVVRRPVGE
ncbi:MAG: phosphoglycerate dehydrogenase [Rhodospirillaceae bacterium]|jgi:phosphoglycerate dehydrogenase-like enzyme|nr:phosphoglycerate dehydrogenase [Rhodospirillaceae bacterium]